MAHDGQARRARQHHADLPAFPRPGAEPGRERLAVSAPELALKHRLRKLRRDRRRRMRRLAKPHRSTRNHHLHRNARLGSRRSAAMTVGIRYAQGPRSAAGASIATPNPTLSAEIDIAKPATDPRVEGQRQNSLPSARDPSKPFWSAA